MSNLLEKASILLTPTAYDDGKILSVKPEEVLGEELVVNGDFSDGSTSWNFGPGWSIVNENASHTGSGSYIEQGSLTQGVSYKVVINVTQASGSGFPQIYMGGLTTAMTSVGVYTFNIVAVANDKIKIRGLNDCEISSVSVKQEIDGDFDFTRNSSATRVNSQGLIEDVQILSSNLVSNGDFSQEGSELVTNGSFDSDSGWTLGTGWSIANGNANSDGVSSNSNLVTTSAFYSGSTPVKMTINVTDYVSGGLKVYLSSTNFTEITANGNYTFYTTADRTDGKLYLKSINFIGSIDNVSVKEVGQDWTLGTGWSIGDGKAESNGSQSTISDIEQNITLNQGSTYIVKFDLIRSAGTLYPKVGNTTGTGLTSTQSVSQNIVAGSSNKLELRADANFIGSITNISVIEITDDTNLPRINYEGFSYQDALGDELVTNGNFDSDSDWAKGTGWSISGGKANANNVPNLQRLQQGLGTSVVGKKYKYSLNITNVSGFYSVYIFGVYVSATSNTEGVIEGEVIATSTNGAFWVAGASASGLVSATVDNVSVKEYLGQEVVPDSGVGSWLFEPQSTNLIIQSENLSSVDWTKSLVTVSANDIASPSGEVNASLIQETVYTSSIPSLKTTNNIPISTGKHTLSFYVKNNNGRYLGISFGNNANRIRTTFDFDTETFKTPLFNGITEGEVSYTTIGDYYRILITANFTSSISGLVFIMPIATDTYPFYAFQNSDNRSFYLWGVQVEASSFATSYIPTSGSTVTRLQDSAFGAGSSDLINSTEGVLYAEILRRQEINDNYDLITLNNGASNSDANSVSIGFDINSDDFFIRVKANGVSVFFNSNISASANQFHKVALKYKSGDCAVWIDGVEQGTGTTTFTFTQTLDNLTFDKGNSTLNFYGKTKALAVFKEALTDEELTCLTTI